LRSLYTDDAPALFDCVPPGQAPRYPRMLLRPIRRLYDWTMGLAAHPHAIWWLALIAFTESIFFPIPQDILLIPMVLAARQRAWFIAGVCTAASVSGGMLGYWIGYELFELIGRPILELYGHADAITQLRGAFAEHGWWIVVGGGLTPFPYKITTIAAGAMALDPWVFMAASLASRGLRFFLLALLLWKFGPPIRAFIEERFGLMTTIFFVLLLGGFVAAAWLL